MLGVTSVKEAAAAAGASTQAGGKVRRGRGKQFFYHAFLPPESLPMLEVGLPTSVKAVRTIVLSGAPCLVVLTCDKLTLKLNITVHPLPLEKLTHHFKNPNLGWKGWLSAG